MLRNLPSYVFWLLIAGTAWCSKYNLKEMFSGRPGNGELDAWFRSLMVSSSNQSGQAESGSPLPTLSGWKDLPVELLLRIISIVGDDRMVIVASGVCMGWRDALGWGVTNLSLSW